MDEKSELLVLNPEDEETFQKLYLEGLKYSKQCSEESMLVPKFYTKVSTVFTNSQCCTYVLLISFLIMKT
jgi:hypothetical protein